MAERAQVTSVQAIDAFRASLILYLGKARASVEEVGDAIKRTRTWIETDRRSYWDAECKRRQRQLDEAQQELFSARLSHFQSQTAAQILAVERAKHAVHQAEEKRELVRRWSREFENRAEPLGKSVEQLLSFFGTDLVKGVAHLEQVLRALESYAETRPSSRPGASTPMPAPAPAPAAVSPDVVDTTTKGTSA